MELFSPLFMVLTLLQCSYGNILRVAPTGFWLPAATSTFRPLLSEEHHGPDQHKALFDETLEKNEDEYVVVTEVVSLTTTLTISVPDQSKQSHPVQDNEMTPNSQTTVGDLLGTSPPLLVNDMLVKGKNDSKPIPDTQTNKSPYPSLSEDSKKGKTSVVHYSIFGQMTHQGLSGPSRPCVLGLSPCVVSTNPNGTNLLWDDLSRTLAFAWELHVFGSAGLFLLLASGTLLGMMGAFTLLHPLCGALGLVNGFLLLSSVLQAVHLLVDPYGTRQILPRPVLTTLHNLPLTLLLWAQVALALVTLRGGKLILLPLKLQHPCNVGCLAVLHCVLLLSVDLLSSSLAPVLPLMLQSLSLCWGLPFCLGILTQSLSHLRSLVRSPIPQWDPPQRIEESARRVTAVCALLGLLCCGFHIYSLLWLYELLGNWRHFGWGWWLGQFWARVLELAWSFSLLALGSWIFWRPGRTRTRSDLRQERQNGARGGSFFDTVLKDLRTGPFRKSEKSLADLLPNNWAGHQRSRGDVAVGRVCDDQPTSVSDMTPEHKSDPVSSTSCDSQAALLWQRVGDRECILSLIEFDMRPLSPINLRRSIDSALHHGQLLGVGSPFTPPPPLCTHNMEGDSGSVSTPTTPANVGYRWELETASETTTPDHFNASEETAEPPEDAGGDQKASPSPDLEPLGEDPPRTNVSGVWAVSQENDWCSDITDL
ncbi:proline-rich transmembrane protein 3-like [Osmerus eperlanus]|uniref:proline-rich transmembrane protein 3-like n=1 Tax=Osmerus eperlanus TaxID=29151 RepID=UPI002E0D4E34